MATTSLSLKDADWSCHDLDNLDPKLFEALSAKVQTSNLGNLPPSQTDLYKIDKS